MPLTVKIIFGAVLLWSSIYLSSAAFWEIKNSNKKGGFMCFTVIAFAAAAFLGAVSYT